MKKYFTILLLTMSITLFSQESIMEKAANATCEYLNTDEIKMLSSNEKTIKLGLFMLSYYSDHKEKFEKEGINVDWDSEDAGEKFGEKIGLKMALVCPDILLSFASEINSDEINVPEIFKVEGRLKSISGDDFSFVHIKDTQGKSQKFLWLSNFSGSDRLIGSDKIKGINVNVTYKNTECYSPKLQEYIIVKEIVEIEYL